MGAEAEFPFIFSSFASQFHCFLSLLNMSPNFIDYHDENTCQIEWQKKCQNRMLIICHGCDHARKKYCSSSKHTACPCTVLVYSSVHANVRLAPGRHAATNCQEAWRFHSVWARSWKWGTSIVLTLIFFTTFYLQYFVLVRFLFFQRFNLI